MLALLYDVHGNLAALEAVLSDAERAGARQFMLGGDYALFGPEPAVTVERLRGLDAQWIRGNVERWTARPAQAPHNPVVRGAIAACREELGDPTVDELAALPETAERDGVLYCHGSPASDVRSFWPEPADDEQELLAGVSSARLVFGHTHLPFRRRSHSGVELVNPGSVGMPFDGDPRAAYALVTDDGDIEHRRVAYDYASAIARLREAFPAAPWVEEMCGRLERAALAP